VATPPRPHPAPAESTAAFEAAVMPHLAAIHRVAIALTGDPDAAADLVQETYLRAFKHWHTYDAAADARRWLATICRNVWRAGRSSAAREASLDEETVDFLPAARLHQEAVRWSLDHMYERLDLGDALSRAIDDLEPAFRQVVLLCDVEDLSYAEAAAALAVPVGTVRSRLFRARHRLQTQLLAWAQDAGLGVPPRPDPS
jgi:RNA polymerase sigma-70 factor (ECF subfamily)